ncbi:MAG: hypothetical protein IJZ37_02095 [Clostridia bacterium]|nr:hypothetical protein [Clostridia bacterium]MBQ8399085.1 hypothetical protein [Clostridia bacterium]
MSITKKGSLPILLILMALCALLLIVFDSTGRSKGEDATPTFAQERQKEEEALSAFLEETKGVGDATVKLCMDDQGIITGAAVICTGGEDPVVQATVIRLLCAALGLPSNKIYVSGSR